MMTDKTNGPRGNNKTLSRQIRFGTKFVGNTGGEVKRGERMGGVESGGIASPSFDSFFAEGFGGWLWVEMC